MEIALRSELAHLGACRYNVAAPKNIGLFITKPRTAYVIGR
jgi:hypothetical protein